MNLPQMREWAAAHHSLAVRNNVMALCDALEAALAAHEAQLVLNERLIHLCGALAKPDADPDGLPDLKGPS